MPAIVNGSQYMQAVLYTGTGATLTISGLNFQPDFVWIKSRSAATDHKLTDSVRGATKALVSNSTAAETTDSTGITAFNSDGFTLGANSTYNNSGATYVAWCWKAGGTAVTNTAGSITSQVSANTTAGFSVVTYTGTGSNASVGHGLGTTPAMVIVKGRGNVDAWRVWHQSLTDGTYYMNLQSTSAQASNNTFFTGLPSSTVINVGTDTSVNQSTIGFVSYCFAAIPGYSAFGSYTGNGSADGPFIFLGFRPRYFLTKRSDSTSDWTIYDSSVGGNNVISNSLQANAAGTETWTTADELDFVSNGVKLRASGASYNASGGTYVYAAFAENPFKNALAR